MIFTFYNHRFYHQTLCLEKVLYLGKPQDRTFRSPPSPHFPLSAHSPPFPLPQHSSPPPMWRITIDCSADDWRINGTAFKELATQYPTKLLSSKKMHGDERRIMEYQIENVSDAEDFTDDCMKLSGFTAMFESL